MSQSTSYTQPPVAALSPNTTINTPGSPQPSAAPGSIGMTYDQVENTWIQAGGNPQAAAMAAAIADASSGLNSAASQTMPDGTTSVGLWLIPQNGSPPGTNDPIANARAAIQMSNNGTDWSTWCSAWSDNNCGLDGGSYLGEGANALASLAQKLGPASYNVIGASPTGTGTSASTVSATTATTSSKHNALFIIIAIVLIIAVVALSRRKTSNGNGESTTRQQSPWTPDEEALLSDSSKTDKELSSSTGRSVRAIRGRRNQLKG